MTDRSGSLRDGINRRFPRLRRVLPYLALGSGLWAVTVAHGDGYEVVVQGVRLLSTRGARNPAIIAGLSALIAWWLSSPSERTSFDRAFTRTAERPWLAHALTLAIAVAVVASGYVKGALVAGGSDSYGYVSQAHLLARGALRIEQPIMAQASWTSYAREAFVPLGYRLSLDREAIVPTYSVGYPLTMAAVERIAGPDAVYGVVPVLGGVAILATYLLGLTLAGPSAGLYAAALLATSPVFVFQLMFPMSDVPVTAWCALTLALIVRGGAASAFGAGVACGLAILTRPNLVPIAIVPGCWLLFRAWQARAGDPVERRRRVRALLLFALASATGAAGVGALNAYWYGSPLLSGYGSTDPLFSWGFVRVNAAHYARWLTDTQTPLLWLAFLAPLVIGRAVGDAADSRRRAWMWFLLAFIAMVTICYLGYVPFEDWFYLRFLLPAFPALTTLATVVLQALVNRFVPTFRSLLVLVIVVFVASRTYAFAASHGGFNFAAIESKYEAAGVYVTDHLPEQAALITLLHSGSARHYSGRLTVRLDSLDGGVGLTSALEELRRLGYRPYFMLEPTDIEHFKERFARTSRLGALDWPPLATIQPPGATVAVRIWDPAQAPTE